MEDAGTGRADQAETPPHRAATIGNALEFYDFLTYAFFSIQIGHAFFPRKAPMAA